MLDFVFANSASNAPGAYERVRVRPLTGALGAEVFDVDLREADDDEFAEVRRAVVDHHVVVVRDQQLTVSDLEQVTQRFGPFGDDPYVAGMDGHPHVIHLRKEADERTPVVFGGAWHSDWSFLPEPPALTLLYGHDVPPWGGDTLYANSRLAYEWFDDAKRAELESLRAVHSPEYGYGPNARHNDLMEHMDIHYGEDATDEHVHPLVRVHPVSGVRSIYANPVYTRRIDGMDPDESAALLDELYRVIANPTFGCRVRWEPGTLTIWDNRIVWHNPVSDYHGMRREMFRTTVRGEAPIPVPA